MSTRIIIGTALFYLTFLSFSSCKRTDLNLDYETILTTEGLIIHDVLIVDDTLLFFSGENELEKGLIGKYNLRSLKNQLRYSDGIVYDLSISSKGIWAAGQDMLLLKTTDLGETWETVNTFEYLEEIDRGDLTEFYAIGNIPTFAIGSKGLLRGNFYTEQTQTNIRHLYPFLSQQLKMGVNDMVLIDSSHVYLSGYGSILHAQILPNKDTLVKYTDVGGENFTGITLTGDSTLASCSFSGSIYTKNVSELTWEKAYESGIPLQFIVGDNEGNLMAVGDKNKICLSNNYGVDWTMLKYASANDITCLSADKYYFWAGNNKGQIIRFERDQLTGFGF